MNNRLKITLSEKGYSIKNLSTENKAMLNKLLCYFLSERELHGWGPVKDYNIIDSAAEAGYFVKSHIREIKKNDQSKNGQHDAISDLLGLILGLPLIWRGSYITEGQEDFIIENEEKLSKDYILEFFEAFLNSVKSVATVEYVHRGFGWTRGRPTLEAYLYKDHSNNVDTFENQDVIRQLKRLGRWPLK